MLAISSFENIFERLYLIDLSLLPNVLCLNYLNPVVFLCNSMKYNDVWSKLLTHSVSKMKNSKISTIK